MEHERNMHGTHKGYARNIREMSMEYVRNMCIYIWNAQRICKQRAWNLHALCKKHVLVCSGSKHQLPNLCQCVLPSSRVVFLSLATVVQNSMSGGVAEVPFMENFETIAFYFVLSACMAWTCRCRFSGMVQGWARLE